MVTPNVPALKPCPFCGATGDDLTVWRSERPGGYGYHLHAVICSGGCGASTSDVLRSDEAATSAWNNRVGEGDPTRTARLTTLLNESHAEGVLILRSDLKALLGQ